MRPNLHHFHFFPREVRESASPAYKLVFGISILLFIVGLAAGVQFYWSTWQRPPGVLLDFRRLSSEWIVRGEWDAATQELRKAADIDPSDIVSLAQAGQARRMAGDLEGEIEFYERAVRQAPGSSLGHMALAEAYLNLKNFELARKHATEAVHLDPESFDAHMQLGMVGFATRDWELARAGFQQAVRLDPGQPEAHYQMGIIHTVSGDLSKAESSFTAANDMDPTNTKYAQVLLEVQRRLIEASAKENVVP